MFLGGSVSIPSRHFVLNLVHDLDSILRHSRPIVTNSLNALYEIDPFLENRLLGGGGDGGEDEMCVNVDGVRVCVDRFEVPRSCLHCTEYSPDYPNCDRHELLGMSREEYCVYAYVTNVMKVVLPFKPIARCPGMDCRIQPVLLSVGGTDIPVVFRYGAPVVEYGVIDKKLVERLKDAVYKTWLDTVDTVWFTIYFDYELEEYVAWPLTARWRGGVETRYVAVKCYDRAHSILAKRLYGELVYKHLEKIYEEWFERGKVAYVFVGLAVVQMPLKTLERNLAQDTCNIERVET